MSKRSLTILVFSLSILALWSFPLVWYTRFDQQLSFFWLAESQNVPGWSFRPESTSASIEARLVADRVFAGEFASEDGRMVRLFSAKRYKENQNEIGLFVHTPDRCWTEAGWRIEPETAETVELNINGATLCLERRVFRSATQRELVYFGGLVGGQPLPYRLDHNLSVGIKHQLGPAIDKTGSALRARDSVLWGRVWDAFVSRRRLLGPKQFLRISTSIRGADVGRADALLRDFLLSWATPADYQEELEIGNCLGL